jgi:uncharacterized protein involved in type VI secretion and phage assembly
VESVSVHHAFNRIPWARLVLVDGDAPNGSVPLSDGELFKPGVEITLKAGYGDAEQTLFTGIVVRHRFRITGDNAGRLIVECQASACRMTLSRQTAQYLDQTDARIIQTLIGNAGLAGSVAATSITHPALVQYDCSDWDFMLARAAAMGLLVNVEGDQVSVQPPPVDAAATLTVTWGEDLIDFDADIDARTPWTAVQASSWEPGRQSLLQGTPARVRGHMSFQGSALARPGALVELAGVGSRFSGTVLLTTVEHEFADGNWISKAEFGLDPAWATQHPDGPAAPRHGLVSGIGGLQVGVVRQLEGDPAGEHRILVHLPACQAATEGLWSRLLHLHASSSFGSFFLPEVGDEVLVGHLDQDPAHPVVLGSLCSSARKPPYALSADNAINAVVTRSRHTIEFNDADKIITVTTPAHNQLVFSDQDKTVVVKDQSGNSITLSESGITLDSPKDITLAARGVITLDAAAAIHLRSAADVTVDGLNVACQARGGMTAKGAVTAELSAAGQTTVRGALVMIN